MTNLELPRKLRRNFELGPIRPPSEAYSLLIRATRNCPWNRCRFCTIYKGSKFELRPVEDVVKDIEAAEDISDGIKEMAGQTGYAGGVRELAAVICRQGRFGPRVGNVALWLWRGGKSVFLQDSNTIIMRTPDLVKVLTCLRSTFPGVDRVTSYGRSHTAARKSPAELRELKDAGLDRVHIGLETGSDALLAYVDKGCTSRQHIEGGRKVREAGLSLCEYVMPGLGGKKMSAEHATETARVLNEIDPAYIRLRSLYVYPPMGLWDKVQEGEFEMLTEDEVVEELGVLIEKLQVTSYLKSDHILNLLMEIEGKLPEDKQQCLDIIGRYLALPYQERLNFQLGRRAGYYGSLGDLEDSDRRQKVDEAMRRVNAGGHSTVEEAVHRLKHGFI